MPVPSVFIGAGSFLENCTTNEAAVSTGWFDSFLQLLADRAVPLGPQRILARGLPRWLGAGTTRRAWSAAPRSVRMTAPAR